MNRKARFFTFIIIGVLNCVLMPFAYAQDLDLTRSEKQLYNENPERILPDARESFREGDYLQTQRLCRFHSFIVSNKDVKERNELWDKAKSCMILTDEMEALIADSKIAEAKERASQLIKLNPNDSNAKEVMAQEILVPVIETPEKHVQPELEPESTPDPVPEIPAKQDTVVSSQTPVSDYNKEIVKPAKNNMEPHTRFGVNAGVTFGSGIFGPDLALSIYDLGGSRIGVEMGAYMFYLNDISFGVDASLAVRIYNNLYAKAGIGTYRIPDEQHGYGVWQATYGICPNVGLSYVIRKHLNLGFCIRYMPETKVRSIDMVSTSINRDYLFADEVVAMKSGIAPSVTIGWVF